MWTFTATIDMSRLAKPKIKSPVNYAMTKFHTAFHQNDQLNYAAKVHTGLLQ